MTAWISAPATGHEIMHSCCFSITPAPGFRKSLICRPATYTSKPLCRQQRTNLPPVARNCPGHRHVFASPRGGWLRLISTVSQRQRRADHALRYPPYRAEIRNQGSVSVPVPGHQECQSPPGSTFYRHASAAVGKRHHRCERLVGACRCQYNSRLRRNRLEDEAQGTGSLSGATDPNHKAPGQMATTRPLEMVG